MLTVSYTWSIVESILIKSFYKGCLLVRYNWDLFLIMTSLFCAIFIYTKLSVKKLSEHTVYCILLNCKFNFLSSSKSLSPQASLRSGRYKDHQRWQRPASWDADPTPHSFPHRACLYRPRRRHWGWDYIHCTTYWRTTQTGWYLYQWRYIAIVVAPWACSIHLSRQFSAT